MSGCRFVILNLPHPGSVGRSLRNVDYHKNEDSLCLLLTSTFGGVVQTGLMNACRVGEKGVWAVGLTLRREA